MLPGISGFMHGATGAGGRSFSYLTRTTDDSGSADEFSFASYGLGDPSAGRRIFFAVHWRENENHRSLTGGTIGGVSYTIHGQLGHSGGLTGFGVAIISAAVPSGATGTVDLTFSGLVQYATIAGIRAVGLIDSTPTDTAFDATAGTAGNLSTTIDVPPLGLTIAAFTSSTNAVGNGVTWGGVTEEYDQPSVPGTGVRTSMAWDYDMSEQTGRTIGAFTATEADAGNSFFAVSWK